MTTDDKAKWAFRLAIVALILGVAGAGCAGYDYYAGTRLTKWYTVGLNRDANDTGLDRWVKHLYFCHEHPPTTGSCENTNHQPPPPPPPKY